MFVYKASREANPADTLISNVWLPELGEINFCWLSCPVCGSLFGSPSKLIHVSMAKSPVEATSGYKIHVFFFFLSFLEFFYLFAHIMSL